MEALGAWQLDSMVNTDAMSLLRGLPDGSVHCAVTSPPYFGLRDYGVDGQIGLEETPEQYVAALVEVFREVRRCLRDDGTLWLNLGDSYVGATSQHRGTETQGHNSVIAAGTYASVPADGRAKRNRALYAQGLGMKQLIGIPWMVAFALRADGWILRSEIIWHKPNCMPESVTDRPTKAHETVFLLTKNANYYYDHEAVKEAAVNGDPASPRGSAGVVGQQNAGRRDKQAALGKRTYTGFNARWDARAEPLTKRNKRSVWTIPTQPYDGAHFAVMPEALVEPCILAGCPETVCAVCGAPHERVVERAYADNDLTWEKRKAAGEEVRRGYTQNRGERTGGNTLPSPQLTTLGFAPTCTCNAGTAHGVVIDPFGGAATVGVVAKRLNRHYLLSEINPAYVELARDRLAGVTPMLAGFA